MSIEKLQYPIGLYQAPETITPAIRQEWIDDLERIPAEICAEVGMMSAAQLDSPYRPGSWTVRQVIHHLCDSHMNSYVRFKWTVTEDMPVIKPYDEKLWGDLPEARSGDVQMSLDLLQALHVRWVAFLRTLSEDQWQRQFIHPESKTHVQLDWNLGMYAWHGRHHLAHIRLVSRP